MKLKRGQKICKTCNAICAARSRICKECGAVFISKNTPIKNEVKDWKSLQKGDWLKVVQGTGPYFTCTRSTEEGSTGDKIYMGSKGKYEVISLDPQGLICKGLGKKNCGVEFVYMGEKNFSEYTGITKEPHRIVKLKTRKRK